MPDDDTADEAIESAAQLTQFDVANARRRQRPLVRALSRARWAVVQPAC